VFGCGAPAAIGGLDTALRCAAGANVSGLAPPPCGMACCGLFLCFVSGEAYWGRNAHMPSARHLVFDEWGSISSAQRWLLMNEGTRGADQSGAWVQGDVRTDLALEALPPSRELCPGVRVEEDETDIALVTRVYVESEFGAWRIGKPPGVYVTIEAEGLRRTNRATQDQIGEVFARELCRLLPYCKPFRNNRVNGRNKHLYCFQVSPSGTESLDIPPGICRNGS